jgi:hypothetical protein
MFVPWRVRGRVRKYDEYDEYDECETAILDGGILSTLPTSTLLSLFALYSSNRRQTVKKNGP